MSMENERWASLPFSKIKLRKIDWLWRPWLPYGMITIVAGPGGVGKSTFVMEMIACVTTGDQMPQIGDEPVQETQRGSALIICKEDDPGLIIKPRLAAAGADMSRVHMVGKRPSSDPDDFEVVDSLDGKAVQLERLIRSRGDVRIILIDPITNFFGKRSLYHDDQIRQVLTPLSRIAARNGIAIICVVHLNKDTQKKSTGRILGGTGIVNVARSTLLVLAAEKNSNRRFLMMDKINLWPDRKSVEFRMLDVEGQPQIKWGTDYEDLDLDEVLAGKNENLTKREEADILLRRWLKDGPLRSIEVRERVKEAGIALNTFKAAKKDIGVVSKKIDDVWWWELPAAE
jgi:putative DNA primase/helicase